MSNSLTSNHGHDDHGASTFRVPFSSLGECCNLVPLILVILDPCFAHVFCKLKVAGRCFRCVVSSILMLDSDDPDLVESQEDGAKTDTLAEMAKELAAVTIQN